MAVCICPWARTRPRRRIKLVNRQRRSPEGYLPLRSLFGWALGGGRDMQRDLIGPPQIRHRIGKSVDPEKRTPSATCASRGIQSSRYTPPSPIHAECPPARSPRDFGGCLVLLAVSAFLPSFPTCCFAPRGRLPASHRLSRVPFQLCRSLHVEPTKGGAMRRQKRRRQGKDVGPRERSSDRSWPPKGLQK